MASQRKNAGSGSAYPCADCPGATHDRDLAPPVLDTAQARVLGCLIEKEATTPDAYPLTVNAAQVAANQKTAREPVLNLQTGVVHHALRQLETLGLVRQQFSSRAERYEHRLGSVLDLTRQQVALIGLLLLRGAQTLGELYARSERLARFNDADDMRHHLDRLIQRGLAAQLPRASGQREDRYAHLLSGELDVEALQAAAARAAPSSAAAATPATWKRACRHWKRRSSNCRKRSRRYRRGWTQLAPDRSAAPADGCNGSAAGVLQHRRLLPLEIRPLPDHKHAPPHAEACGIARQIHTALSPGCTVSVCARDGWMHRQVPRVRATALPALERRGGARQRQVGVSTSSHSASSKCSSQLSA